MHKIPSYQDLAFEWLGMSRQQREEAGLPAVQSEFAQYIGIGATKMKKMKRLYYAQKMERETKARDTMEVGIHPKEEPQEEGKDEIQEVLNNLLALSKHNAAAGKFFIEITKMIEGNLNQKEKYEFSPADHIRMARKADERIKELSRNPDGSEGLSEESSILPD